MEELDYTMAMVELEDGSLCAVDLNVEEHRGDIEPYIDLDDNRALHCTLGVEGEDNDSEKKEIVKAYFASRQMFNGKFDRYVSVDLGEFVARFLDAEHEWEDDMGQEEVLELKDYYGISDKGEIRRNP